MNVLELELHLTHEQMNILNPFKCCALNPNVYTVDL